MQQCFLIVFEACQNLGIGAYLGGPPPNFVGGLAEDPWDGFVVQATAMHGTIVAARAPAPPNACAPSVPRCRACHHPESSSGERYSVKQVVAFCSNVGAFMDFQFSVD